MADRDRTRLKLDLTGCLPSTQAQRLSQTVASAAADSLSGLRTQRQTINLGADHIEHYSKSIAVDANDTDPNDIDTGIIAAIATKKLPGGGDGEGHI